MEGPDPISNDAPRKEQQVTGSPEGDTPPLSDDPLQMEEDESTEGEEDADEIDPGEMEVLVANSIGRVFISEAEGWDQTQKSARVVEQVVRNSVRNGNINPVVMPGM